MPSLESMDGFTNSVDPRGLLADLVWTKELARRLVADAATADDLSQDTWFRALGRSWPEGRPSRAWLATVLRNLSRERHRQDQRRTHRERGSARREALPSSRELVERLELQQLLADEVLALEEPYRSVVLLVVACDVKPVEIARERGIPATTIRSHLSRGLAKLRERLGDRDGQDGNAWLASLVPLALEAPSRAKAASLLWSSGMSWIGLGGLTMKAIAVAGTLGLLLALGWWWFDHELPVQEAALPSNVVEETRVAATSEAGQRASRPDESSSDERVAADADAAPSTRTWTAPLFLRLVDDRTGEAVPFVSGELLVPGDEPRVVRSDALGLIEGTTSFAAGRLRLQLTQQGHTDDLLQTRRREAGLIPDFVEFDHGPERTSTPVEVAIPAGPTFPLRYRLPAGVAREDLSALLTSADASKAFDKMWADVRGEGDGWVRFGPGAHLIGGAPELALTLGTRDGLWFARAEVAGTAGLQPTVELELAARGALNGVLLAPSGEPLEKQWVLLRRTGLSNGKSRRVKPLLTGQDGAFHSRWLEPGAYGLSVEREGAQAYNDEIEIVRSAATDVVVQLESDGVLREGSIRGRVVTSTGNYEGKIIAVLLRPSTQGWNQTQDVEWASENESVLGSFEFEGLAEDDYVLSFIATDGARFDPPHLEVRPSTTRHEIYVHVADESMERTLELRVRSAKNQEVLRAYDARVEWTGGPTGRTYRRVEVDEQGRGLLEHVPLEGGFEWRILARDHQPAWGDQSAARELDGRLQLDVSLREGWGADLVVLGVEDERLGAVEVRADGVSLGKTDHQGRLRLVADATPRRLRLVLDGWEMHEPFDADGFSIREWSPTLTLRMQR